MTVKKEPIYIDGKEYWKCPWCSKILPPSEFFNSGNTPNKLTSRCKICHTICVRKTSNPETVRHNAREQARIARAKNPDGSFLYVLSNDGNGT